MNVQVLPVRQNDTPYFTVIRFAKVGGGNLRHSQVGEGLKYSPSLWERGWG